MRGSLHDLVGLGRTAAVTVTPSFWAGRRVLLTGHTGFKGGWLAVLLSELGATVTGVGLAPEDPEGICGTVGVEALVDSHILDIADADRLAELVRDADPEVVLHLAAQALVLPSIEQPAQTFATNVVGTANLLAACASVARGSCSSSPATRCTPTTVTVGVSWRATHSGVVTPTSASKAATELVVRSWRHTYWNDVAAPALVTARAGNVIGGGDVAPGRLLPDLLRAFAAGEVVRLRQPAARRPWQFVLDPLSGYLTFVEALARSDSTGNAASPVPSELNFGPSEEPLTVAEVADKAIRNWGSGRWEPTGEQSVEAPVLALDASLARSSLGWHPVLGVDDAIEWTVDWLRAERAGDDLGTLCRDQIATFRGRAGW